MGLRSASAARSDDLRRAEPLGDLQRELARRAVDQHGFSGLELGVLSRAAYDDAAGSAISAAVTSLSSSRSRSQQIPVRLSPSILYTRMHICRSLDLNVDATVGTFFFELQKNEVKRLKSLSRAQNCTLHETVDRRVIPKTRSVQASPPRVP
jgi:hypothetical protein